MKKFPYGINFLTKQVLLREGISTVSVYDLVEPCSLWKLGEQLNARTLLCLCDQRLFSCLSLAHKMCFSKGVENLGLSLTMPVSESYLSLTE